MVNIADILIKNGLLPNSERETALKQAGNSRIDRFLIERGSATEEQVLRAFAREFGTRFLDVSTIAVDQDLLSTFPSREISRHRVFPIERTNGTVVVATSDPFDFEALDELGSMTGYDLEPVFARQDDLNHLIKNVLGLGGGIVGELLAQKFFEEIEHLDAQNVDSNDIDDMAQQPSVINLVNELLADAVNQRASDVHIEPLENRLTIRFRVDGVLHVQPVPPEIKQFYAPIVTRLKIMSRLNIAEKRLPQDGRIKLRFGGHEIDVRTSIIPMLHGEGVVLRILDKERMVFDLSTIGLPPQTEEVLRELITLPHGIILATGPTGSGKTSTLYSILNSISRPAVKIVTVEDPVEYHLDGISQIQVHSKIGLTFASGLRSIFRHDPDVILVGEIRDTETAESAIQASMTGHLVLSTLHTNDSCGALTRLIDMGVEPFLVASSVEAVVAQRLVRVLCPHCKVTYRPDAATVPPDFPRPLPNELWKPTACRECGGKGYKGRIGIFEVLANDDGVRRLCVERATTSEIRRHALEQGNMITLRQSGWQQVLLGTTSIEEVTQVTKGMDGRKLSPKTV